MKTYVFDTSAIVRWLKTEAGNTEVERILTLGRQDACRICMSAVNWGEVIQVMTRAYGLGVAESLISSLDGTGLVVIDATAERARKAALIQLKYKIAYADCFGVELAGDSLEHILVIADYGVKPAELEFQIQFLPTKPKP